MKYRVATPDMTHCSDIFEAESRQAAALKFWQASPGLLGEQPTFIVFDVTGPEVTAERVNCEYTGSGQRAVLESAL